MRFLAIPFIFSYPLTTCNYSLGHLTVNEEIGSLPSATRLLEIQNIYVDIMFKYMTYRYGYDEATLRFATIIKHFLDQSMCTIHAEEVQVHAELVQTIINDIERSLTLLDETDI